MQNDSVAQLDRAFDYESKGQGFESLRGRHFAGIAQLVEQLTCNQQVGGSIPLASSIFLSTDNLVCFILYGGVPEWPKGADCKSAGVRLRRFESFSLHH